MGSNPINLGVRFVLEIGALAALAWWGRQQASGVWRYVLTIGIPLLAAIVWGTFAVPDDPSRSGEARVPVPGLVRLIIELAVFGLATWALFVTGATTLGWVFGVAVVVHYAISYDRVAWLVRQ